MGRVRAREFFIRLPGGGDLTLPSHLRIARERRDISVRDLADTVGVTPATLRKYETGVIPVPDDVLIAIALTLGDRALLEQPPVPRALRSWPKAS